MMQKSTEKAGVDWIEVNVTDMQCGGCETVIEEALIVLDGVQDVSADYPTGSVKVAFDSEKAAQEDIEETIEASGYHVASTEPVKPAKPGKKPGWLKFIVALLAVIVLAVVMVSVRKLSHQFSLPDFDSRLSDGMILIIGLVTGLHCIGMCGGFVISYTARDAGQGRPSFLSHLLYGLGKTLSYAMFGAMFGLLGSMISITPFMKGVTNIAAGGFLVLFGLNMLGFFKILRHVRIKQPKSLARFASRHQRQSRSPLFIGFFTGFLLGCGPLQAMYVLAAGSSDPLVGAKILTLFGLGTLPALFSFGFLTRWISSQATHRFFQLSGVILIFVGMMMTNKGLIRTQSGYDFQSIKERIMLEMQQMD